MNTRLRHVAQVNPLSRRFDRLADDDLVPFLPMENVWPGDKLDLSHVRPKSDVAVGYTRFQSGDVVVPKITPTFEASRSALIPELPNSVGTGTTEIHVVRPGSDIESRYLLHIFHSYDFLKLGKAEMYGVAGQKRVPDDFIRNWTLDLPPLDEQRRIADFLDAETARIDALSKAYETTKSTISERAQCLIDLLVDEAGNPLPLKYFVRFREGPGIMAADFREQGTPLIRISGLRDGIVTLTGANYLDSDTVSARWAQFRLRSGDYLISGSATMGAVSVVRDPGVVGAIPYTGLIILRPADPAVVMEYVATALNSSLFTRQIDLLKAGATMQHFGPTHLAQVSLPFPSYELQNNVAAAAREIGEQSSRATAAINRQLTLLAERRQALITAGVTGQIDVTTAPGLATIGGAAV